MSLIDITGLKKNFQGSEVIKGLNFKLKKGKCIALLGPNGAGKTTTLRMLAGLMKPSEGEISFNEIKNNSDIRHLIGYLPQFPVFYDWMTGFEFLVYVGKLGGLSGKEAKNRSLELLELVGILDAKNRRVGKYSGGMKQRLGIAQAIIHYPQLVMLDEPVSALDPFGRREVLELLERLKEQTTILFSTHILNDAEEVCDEILFLHNGRIVESGTMEELRARHQKAKIDLFFRKITEDITLTIKNHPITMSVLKDGDKMSIFVNDVDFARRELLQLVSERDWPLDKFEICSMTLEDVFMKVVEK
ncbi:ATP-binding cassette domain-containing protein [Neobacillus sp. K501]